MRYSIILLVSTLLLLVSPPAFASVSRFTVAGLPTCGDAVADGKMVVVTDPTTDEDCITGSGSSEPHECICDWDGAVGTWRLHSHSSIDNDLVVNESGADVDFRVEGDTEANLFFTDGSAESIGIRTASPAANLHVVQQDVAAFTPSSTGNVAVFEDTANNGISIVVRDTDKANLYFATPSDNVGARVQWDFTGNIWILGTAKTGADVSIETSNASEAIRILDTGEVGIGTANPNEGLTLEGGVLSLRETTAPTATTNYGKIWTESNNELFFQDGDGDTHIIHGPAFGHLWHHGISFSTVTISTQSQAVQIDSFSVIGGLDDLGNVTGSVSTDLLTIGANGAGAHDIGWHASFKVDGGAAREMIILPGITLASTNTVTGATETTPIVLTIGSHPYENGDMLEVVAVGGNTAANGTRILQNVGATTVDLYDAEGDAVASNGTYTSGGEITIFYPGELLGHRSVSQVGPGVAGGGGAAADVRLESSDAIGIYVINLSSTNDLLVLQISLGTERIGN